MPWPLAPKPSYYAFATWFGDPSYKNAGLHYPGDTPQIHLNQASGATSYEVIWWNAPNGTFDTVSTGSLTGTETTVTPAAPAGGWKPGWYRIYGSGPNTDSLFGNAYFVTNFCFLRNNSNFIPAPVPPSDLSSIMFSPNGIDFPIKGVLGIGTSRLQIDDATDPTNPVNVNTIAAVQNLVTNYAAPYWTTPSSQYIDPARPRYLWCAFPNSGVDFMTITPASGGNNYLKVVCKTAALDGSKVFVSSGPGSSTGYKVQVWYPDASTLVETYDNMTGDPGGTINASSSYIFAFNAGANTAATISPTAIGNAHFNGVKACVAALYPYGVTYFEGPENEGAIGAFGGQKLYLFTAAVHAGNAAAKAIGPCSVSIHPVGLTTGSIEANNWNAFGAQCQALGFTPDGISTHAYNDVVQGDINCGRASLSAWLTNLQFYFGSSIDLWQTESTWVTTAVSNSATTGVHHPRRAARELAMRLLFEEYGIPREKNNPWYDFSHGFWGVPAFWEAATRSLQPQAILYRILAEETWGMTFQSAYALPSPADKFLLAQHYSGSSGGCALFQLASWMDNSTVTLSVSGGPSSLTVSDAFGNLSTHTVTGGKLDLPLSDVPTYVRLPVGVGVSVTTVNGWNTAETTISTRPSCVLGGSATTVPVDGAWLNSYETYVSTYPSGGGMVSSSHGLPDSAVFNWTEPHELSRVLIWAGPIWQKASTLLTFTVDLSSDGGSTWTTNYSFDASSLATTRFFGAQAGETGTQRESLTWPEQWIFDCPMPGVVSCNAVRISCTAASLGGEVDSGLGQGTAVPQITLQEVLFRGFPPGHSSYSRNINRSHTPVGHSTW